MKSKSILRKTARAVMLALLIGAGATNLCAQNENIDFTDENVKAICVGPLTGWDTNKDGDLSYAEAAAVKDLGQVFRYNTDIKSFYELEYFMGLTEIPQEAFEGCTNLAIVNIPNTVTSIGGWAFSQSGLLSIYIPELVESIGQQAFGTCNTLQNITVSEDNLVYDSRENCNAIIRTADHTLVAGCKNTIIPNTVTSIGYASFYDCYSLTSIDIPSSVTTIQNYAFYGCNLTSITIPASVEEIGYVAFFTNNTKTIIVRSNTPPTLHEDGSFAYDEFVSVFVPCGSLEAYQNASGWSEFTNIVGDCPIYFVDPNVKAICVDPSTGWDLNGDGDLSYTEAAAVTSLDWKFQNKQNITSFNELQYFTGLSNIWDSDFMFCNGLTSIIIPNTVTFIGKHAFDGCTSLIRIEIPNSVTEIKSTAFQNNNSLISVIIGSSVASIEETAFVGCTSLELITVLATNPPILGTEVFYGVDMENCQVIVPCESLEAYQNASGWSEFTNIVGDRPIYFVDPNVKAICEDPSTGWDLNGDGDLSYAEAAAVTDLGQVFRYNTDINSFYELEYFMGLTEIPQEAFEGCTNLAIVNIPNTVTSIGYASFYGCYSLTSIDIPSSVTTIQNYAFYGCNLTSITIPASVKKIGYVAFFTYNTKTIIVRSNTPPTLHEDGSFAYDEFVSVFVPCGSLEAYQNASGWSEFTNIVGDCPIYFVDPNVKAICVDPEMGWDTNGDGNLSYTEAAAVTQLSTTFMGNDSIRSFNELQYFTGLTEISPEVFYSCTNLHSVTLPNTVKRIGVSSFNSCYNLTSINIPSSVTTIESSAFYDCSSLVEITIPASMEYIGYDAFRECVGLEIINVLATEPPTLDTDVFYGVDMENCQVIVPCESLEAYQNASGWSEFTNFVGDCYIVFADQLVKALCVDPSTGWDIDGNGELSYDEAAAVTDLGEVFKNQQQIISFNELQYFTSLSTIGDEAFSSCVNLASITLPNSVTSIGNSAFWNCIKLTLIEFRDSVTTIGEIAFQNSGLTSVIIPNSVISIGDFAFAECRDLTSVTIGGAVTSIGVSAFYYCTGIELINVLATVPPILGDYIFDGVDKTIPVYVPCGSLEAYQNASGWSEFTNYIPDCETVLLPITGYGDDPNTTAGWHLIASPIWGQISPTEVGNMLSNEYDLYRFDGENEGAEWCNHKNNEIDLCFGEGYLYANSDNVELEFFGGILENGTYTRSLYTADTKFGNWNLIGNSFLTAATVSVSDYYRIEEGTRYLTLSRGYVNAMEGIFVEASSTLQEITFTKVTRGERVVESPMVNIDLRDADGRLLDRARLRMGEGNNLSKLDLLSDPNRLYFRMDGKDYAVARVNGQGEMPLNFDAAQNGTYTLNVNVEGMNLDYLHLIDNMTGADVDLLATPSYTFNAKMTDYASRFGLVFNASSNAADGSFAFIDGNGNIVVNGAEAGATLQIVDMMGRVVLSTDVARNVSTQGIAPGVYVMRLIDGKDVKTQKIVVK